MYIQRNKNCLFTLIVSLCFERSIGGRNGSIVAQQGIVYVMYIVNNPQIKWCDASIIIQNAIYRVPLTETLKNLLGTCMSCAQ